VFHSLGARLPDEIQINHEISNNHVAYTDIRLMDIPQALIDKEQVILGEGIDVFLARVYEPRMELLPERAEIQINYEGVIIGNDGLVRAQLLIYGGREVTSRITFFVNHQPVQVNAADFIELQLAEGQMTLLDVELMLDELDDYNALYAIMMATGEDYLIQDNMFKTRTLLLVSE